VPASALTSICGGLADILMKAKGI